MLFQITGTGWPVGDKLIPAGTVLDWADDRDQWANLAKSVGVLPKNCMSLDQDAHDYAVKHWPRDQRPIPSPDLIVGQEPSPQIRGVK
jgi:hypothetical protein